LPSLDELQALADSKLAPSSQERLDELLAQNAESQLSDDEVAQLDYLLAQVDQLTILKTRAKYTLKSSRWASHRFVSILTIAKRCRLRQIAFCVESVTKRDRSP
jgi:hypothetical protein